MLSPPLCLGYPEALPTRGQSSCSTSVRQHCTPFACRVYSPYAQVLEDAHLKLASVVTHIYSVAARAMVAVILDGQRDVERLTDVARGRLQATHHQYR